MWLDIMANLLQQMAQDEKTASPAGPEGKAPLDTLIRGQVTGSLSVPLRGTQ